MAPNTANNDDEISLSGSVVLVVEDSNDFIFDMSERWQSAYLDSLSSCNFNESTSSLSIPAFTDGGDKNFSLSSSSSSSSSTEFIKKKISKASSFKDERPSSRRSKFARSISKSSSSKDGNFRRRRMNRGESKLQRLSVPTTVSVMESKMEA